VSELRPIIVVGTTTTPQQPLLLFTSWTITDNFDSGGDITFELNTEDPGFGFLQERASDLWLYRDGDVIDRFRVLACPQQWTADGSSTVSVTGINYKRIFNSRILIDPPVYSSLSSQSGILSGLIDNVQAQTGGDYGIAYTGTPSPTPRIRTEYATGDNAGDRLAQLAGVGLWWTINPDDLTIRTVEDYPAGLDGYFPEAWPTRTTPIQLGVTARTMRREPGPFANAVLVDGDSAATTPEVRETSGLASDPRGRWDATASFSSVTRQTTLEDHADKLLDELSSPSGTWTVDIDPARYASDAFYQVGDFATLVRPTNMIGYDPAEPTLDVQVMSTSWTLTADGENQITITAVQKPPTPS
jgi:hypothetical protein